MKKVIVACLLSLTCLLCGCSMLSLESSNIMCPPKATGNKADIQKLIDKQTSGEYTLKYPKNGTNRSAIVTFDIDKDEEEEAVAFYSDKKNDHIHALFVECDDEDYSVVDDIVFDGAGIDRIEFCDIDNNDSFEILIGYTTSTSSQSTLNIYSYGKKIKQIDDSFGYSSLVAGDFNEDKRDDILLISLYSGDIASQAKLLLSDNNGGITEYGTVELDSDITQLASVQYGQISPDTYGAVIDGISSTGDYTTQIVFFDNAQAMLLNPLFSYSGYSTTRRSTQICSLDFNNDELIDIPICSLMGYDQTENAETVCRRIDWSNFDSKAYALNSTVSTIICPADGYTITIPDKWDEAVTARYNKETRETTVYVYEYVKNKLKITDTLLTIKAFSADEYSKDSSGFIELANTGSTIYAYSIGEIDNYLSISGDEVKSLFSLVNQ